MKDWHESQESWARLVAELRAENASLHIHQCRDLESGRERDALVERLQRTIGESMGEVDRLRAELDDLRCDDSCSRTVEELQARAWDAEAAIARVREACEAHRHGLMSPCAVDIVLEALDGGSE